MLPSRTCGRPFSLASCDTDYRLHWLTYNDSEGLSSAGSGHPDKVEEEKEQLRYQTDDCYCETVVKISVAGHSVVDVIVLEIPVVVICSLIPLDTRSWILVDNPVVFLEVFSEARCHYGGADETNQKAELQSETRLLAAFVKVKALCVF